MTAGIVCEYNPFHNGHLYHIEQTRKAGADKIICVMSGNFVQRGECACTDKWQRARSAVEGGADLVIDLPVPWATGSAESFARGSIYLLSCFNIDMLSFGCETDNIELLQLCAENSESEEVSLLVKKHMSQGSSYPAAFSLAMGELYGNKVQNILSSPNSILGIEYIKKLKKYAPECKALPVKRHGAEHDGEAVSENFASASKVREMLCEGDFTEFLPDFSASALKKAVSSGCAPCKTENAERAILSSLREIPKDEYIRYVTDEGGLVSRIYESVKAASDLNELYEKAKSKNYTHARVRREVMALYLKIEKDIALNLPPYIRVLAANERGLSLLPRVKNRLPLITKHSEAVFSDEFSKRVYELQCSSTDKFALMSPKVRECGLEQINSIKTVR